MSAFWVDTERALTMAAVMAGRADELAGAQRSVEVDLDRLQLGTVQSGAVQHLASACTELWVDSAYLRLVVADVGAADARFDVGGVAALRERAGHQVRVSITDACLAPWVAPTYSSTFGDLGGTFGAEVRSPFFVVGTSGDARGRSLIARALADTASSAQIRADEFELVELANGRFLVVLPGVTDLSSPHLGLDEGNRTVRDLDQHAYPSSMSTAVADNAYARLVWDSLDAAGVPRGADVMIVGHSFGADTALDLAADPGFNGPDGYHVTHVVAAGYYSDPQLRHVDPSTDVLVLQNHRDAAVIAEAVGHGNVTATVEDAGGFFSELASFDLAGALVHGAGALYHGGGAVIDGVEYTIGNADDLAEVGVGVITLDGDRVRDGAGDFVTLDPRVTQVDDHQLVDVFTGGGEGVGHHPDNYIEHVTTVDDGRLRAFFESIDDAGYTVPGTSYAIDVSVPAD